MLRAIKNWFADRLIDRCKKAEAKGYACALKHLQAGCLPFDLEAAAALGYFNYRPEHYAFDRGMMRAIFEHRNGKTP